MKSASRLIALGAFVLAGGLFAGSAYAQSQQIGDGDPFSGMPAADNDQMSDVNGELPGVAGARSPAAITGDNCGAGASCSGGAVGTDVGSTTREVAASGNGVTINVTAINVQTSIIGTGVVNTGGGLNSAGAN